MTCEAHFPAVHNDKDSEKKLHDLQHQKLFKSMSTTDESNRSSK